MRKEKLLAAVFVIFVTMSAAPLLAQSQKEQSSGQPNQYRQSGSQQAGFQEESKLSPEASKGQEMRDQRQRLASPMQDEPRARARSESLQEGSRSNISMDTQTSLERSASLEDMRAISYAAGRLLVHVDRARSALNEENSEEALSNVNQAQTLAKIVENNASIYRVTTSISSGNLKYSTDERVKSLLIPIYTELERVSIIAPIAAAKQSDQSRTGSKQQAAAPKVSDVDIAATSIQLDVASADEQLQQAKSAIQQGNLEQANQALKSIQQNVVLSYVAVDMPLVQARQNLMLAEVYSQDGRTQDVKRLLQSVSNSLEQYAQNVGSSKAKEVKSLRDEIENTRKGLEKDQQLATQQVNEWWQQIANLSA